MKGPVRLAVLGDPLAYTLSPVLHRAGCAAFGLACESRALRTSPESLAAALRALADEGALGCNLTHPLKEPALAHVATLSDPARRARSVNTVAFRSHGWHGATTDGTGFLDLLRERGRDVTRSRVTMLGAGGAVRSLAQALRGAGVAALDVSARRRPEGAGTWDASLDARFLAWRSDEERAALGEADVVVNGTPLSGADDPAPLEAIARGALVIDLTYGEALTPWVVRARAAGLEAIDGLGLLVHQARHSLTLWLERDVPLAPLASAVGWPR